MIFPADLHGWFQFIFQPCLMKPEGNLFLGRLNGCLPAICWRWLSSSYRPSTLKIHHESWIFSHLSGKSSADSQAHHFRLPEGTCLYRNWVISQVMYIYIIIYKCLGFLRNWMLYIIYIQYICMIILYCRYVYIYIFCMHFKKRGWRPGAPVDVPGEQPGLVSWRRNGRKRQSDWGHLG